MNTAVLEPKRGMGGLDIPADDREVYYVNGHPVRKGTSLSAQEIEELRDIFTGLNIDAKELRRIAWRGDR